MSNLEPFFGNWDAKNARHLLRRVSFGVDETMVSEALTLGLNGTIDKLFEESALPNPPLKYQFDGTTSGRINDPDANYGETWVNGAPLPEAPTTQDRNRILRSRNRSFYAWSYLQMQNAGLSIREKLTLFWHNHFVSENPHPHREYYYSDILRKNALGNFKELVKQITIDPNMLIYLSGNQNSNTAPNENYARELLELFTIGKGDAVGNGDYTHYTEEDVIQIAKCLTGWRVRGLAHEDTLNPFFSNFRHTGGSKTLSHRFNNAVIEENGANEYIDVIELIFQQDECSKFITRQLYIWFVSPEITVDVEQNIITPLALMVKNNNYDIKPALKILLASNHFFESTFCVIKSPIDLLISATKTLNFNNENASVNEQYSFSYIMYLAASAIDQSIYHHPDVAGWKAYYQQPLYDKTWVNSFLLPKRLEFCKTLVTGGQLQIENRRYTIVPMIPVLEVAASVQDATDPNVLINKLAERLFNYQITQSQVDSLKAVLIDGLPDFEWTVEYSNYLANPSDEAMKVSVERKLRNLISTMVQMSEFQIM